MSIRRLKISPLITAIMAGALLATGALAQSKLIQQGIDDYNKGDYENASGHLGEALSTDFNNPTLHYFLGSSYVHLKQRDGAIREFRIAYALQPSGEVGDLSKKALSALGVKPTGSAQEGAKALPESTASLAPVDPIKDRAVSSLKQQAETLKSARTGESQSQADEASKHATDEMNRQRDAMNDLYKHYSRRGGVYQMPLPPEAQKQLDSLKAIYDTERSTLIQSGTQRATEIQKSSDNLQQLLDARTKPGEAKLVPAGTNLYIRNYAPAYPEKPAKPTPTK